MDVKLARCQVSRAAYTWECWRSRE